MVEGAHHQPVIAVSGGPRIAYSTSRRTLDAPADRRRFCHYAARRGLAFDLADRVGGHDVVVATCGADLGMWSRMPRPAKLVLDMVDSHLAVPRGDRNAVLRGLVKFAFRRTRHLHLDYRRLVEDTCRRADAVICTTEEQRQQILAYCPNVHVILDFQPEASTRVKPDYRRGEVFNLIWEGLPWSIPTFSSIAEALVELERRHRIALHLITDPGWPLAFGDTLKVSTRWRMRRHIPIRNVYLHQWNAPLYVQLCTAGDLAIIPIPLDVPIYAGKPENKLVLFWRMAMPVATSATPAYERAMKGAGLSMTCRTTADWIRVIERAMGDEAMRREAGERGRAYAEATYSEVRLLAQWDAVFASLES